MRSVVSSRRFSVGGFLYGGAFLLVVYCVCSAIVIFFFALAFGLFGLWLEKRK